MLVANGVGHLPQLRLREHPFTEGLSDAQVAALTIDATETAFQAGEVVLAKGEVPAALYLVLEGTLAVELAFDYAALRVDLLEPGDVFGWSVFLEKQESRFQVRAMQSTRTLRIARSTLMAACDADAYLAAELLRRALRVAVDRLRTTEEAFAAMYGLRR